MNQNIIPETTKQYMRAIRSAYKSKELQASDEKQPEGEYHFVDNQGRRFIVFNKATPHMTRHADGKNVMILDTGNLPPGTNVPLECTAAIWLLDAAILHNGKIEA